ncbi:hypothetical protein [Rhodococcoides fascians]|uniref:hypothetical protein n=1 Tax=Rhodococcoides fascians TaxID=1828 RepID=UPI00056202A2|nr:hypothetical protein [Rhodococcus fascians]
MLGFALAVNRDTIGHFEARRMTGIENPRDINMYQVRVYDYPEPLTYREVLVDHREADGAWVLVRKALEALELDEAAALTGQNQGTGVDQWP